jgi:hypothetical protein
MFYTLVTFTHCPYHFMQGHVQADKRFLVEPSRTASVPSERGEDYMASRMRRGTEEREPPFVLIEGTLSHIFVFLKFAEEASHAISPLNAGKRYSG